MLQFLYSGEYKVEESSEDPYRVFQKHMIMYFLGKRYATPALCEYSITTLAGMIELNCSNEHFLRVVRWVYKNEPDKEFQLREKVLDGFSSRAEDLLASDKDSERLIKLMQENHLFCKDIAFKYLEILRQLHKRKSIGNVGDSEPE